MENWIFPLAAVLLAIAVYLGHRLIKSPVWKQRQLRRASEMAAAGKVEEMISYLQANRDRKKVTCPLTNALIFYFIRSGQTDRAEKVVMEAVGAGDDSGTAMAQMAYIAQQRGDSDDAEKFYRQAMDKEPKLAGTMKVNLAGLLIEGGDRLEEAETLLEEALEQREGSGKSGVYLNLAMLHMKRGDFSRARMTALTSAELLPNTPITALGRAQAFGLAARSSIRLKDRKEAKRLAEKALKVLGDLPGADKLRGELQEMTGAKPKGGN